MAAMPFPCNGHLLSCMNIPTVLLMFFNKFAMLCILTSERVLRTPFAGRNQFFDAKTRKSISTSKLHCEHPFAG